MTIDEFTDNCVARAQTKVSSVAPENVAGPGNVAIFDFGLILVPLIQTAIEFIVSKLANCGQNNTEKVNQINDGSFGSRYIVNVAVRKAAEETDIPWAARGAARNLAKTAILDEAKETGDDQLLTLFGEGDSYSFDARSAWDF